MTRNERAGAFLILAVVVGGISARPQNWWTFAAMVALAFFQRREVWRAQQTDMPRVTPTDVQRAAVRGEPRD